MQQEPRTARLVGNDLLRQERQRRGWSRMHIADEIGVADPKTIGRWERGDAFPSAFFLQRLCSLFQMPAEELGLWQRESASRSALPAENAPACFTQPHGARPLPLQQICDPALPPPLLEPLPGRAHLLNQIKERLCGESEQAVAALTGWPGVGKTALATSLAHDSELRQHFPDGILWACLGPDADLLDELRRWGRVLEIDEHQLAHPDRGEDWSRAIHACLAERSLLLIIDDAWSSQDALAFKLGGPNCAYLLTTRIPAVALYFAEEGALRVDELEREESLQVLARYVPALAVQERAALSELARLAGGLPLALRLIGTHLRTHLHSGQPRRWRAALEYLQQPAARLQLTIPRAPLEQQMGLPLDAPISLQNEIELSYRSLPRSARLALTFLADLPNVTQGFSEEDALTLNGVTLETLDHLLDAGLLASTGIGRYTLHQTIADFANCQAELLNQRKDELPPQLSVLRHLRGHWGETPERSEYPTYAPAEVVPTLIQRAEETAMR